MNPHDPMFETTEYKLERLKQLMEYRFSPHEWEAMRFNSRMDPYGNMILRIEQEMLGERIQRNVDVFFESRYPATWWQHVKQEFFPAWLLRWYPVRYAVDKQKQTISFERMFVFPNAYVENHAVLGNFKVRDYVQVTSARLS